MHIEVANVCLFVYPKKLRLFIKKKGKKKCEKKSALNSRSKQDGSGLENKVGFYFLSSQLLCTQEKIHSKILHRYTYRKTHTRRKFVAGGSELTKRTKEKLEMGKK